MGKTKSRRKAKVNWGKVQKAINVAGTIADIINILLTGYALYLAGDRSCLVLIAPVRGSDVSTCKC